MRSLFADAMRRVHLRTAALLLFGNALLAALLGAWLQIPDSHTWEFCFAILSGAALLLAYLWLHAVVLREIRGAVSRLWVSMLVLVPWAALWWKLNALVAHIQDQASQRAGYWNSKMSPGLRHTLPYERLIALQLDVITLLVWFVIPALLLPFVIETVTQGPRTRSFSSAARTLAAWQHWLATGLVSVAAYWVTAWLLGWHPEASPWAEVLGLVARVGIVAVVDAALLLLLLAIDAELLHRRNVPAVHPTANSL